MANQSRLTSLDVGKFRAFGFVVLRNCLTHREVAELAGAYKRVMARAPKYDYFGSNGTRTLLDFVEEDDTFARLVGHPRVMEAMRNIWGTECLYVDKAGCIHCSQQEAVVPVWKTIIDQGRTGGAEDGCAH